MYQIGVCGECLTEDEKSETDILYLSLSRKHLGVELSTLSVKKSDFGGSF